MALEHLGAFFDLSGGEAPGASLNLATIPLHAENGRQKVPSHQSSLVYTLMFTIAIQETLDSIGLSHLSRSETTSGGGNISFFCGMIRQRRRGRPSVSNQKSYFSASDQIRVNPSKSDQLFFPSLHSRIAGKKFPIVPAGRTYQDQI